MNFSGVYKKAGRELIDWNEELTTAYKQGIAGAWELVFGSQIPRILESFHVVAQECMEAFHEELLEAAPLAQARRIKMLHPQLMLCVQAIKDGQADFGETIQEWQREASRELTPAIKNYMKAAYDDCKEKRGKGAFSRMKAIIQNQAKNSPRNEFNKISKRIKRNKCKT